MAKCINPITLKSKEVVPCGKCNFCLSNKRQDWTFRLKNEWKHSETALFLTMTYAPENIPVSASGLPELRKDHFQKFMKRLRKLQAKVNDKSLRYYAVGEYGTRFNRPHYHAILFNLDRSLFNDINKAWTDGFTVVGSVTGASIHYVTKYVINKDINLVDQQSPFSLMSRRPAIGFNYVETHKKFHVNGKRNFTMSEGHIGRLPRFYKDKFFNRIEKDLMKIEALELSDQDYYQEIKRLSKVSKDPAGYYDEMERHAYESVKSKTNKTNTL